METVLFDVCNDYSLDKAEDQTEPDPKVYRTEKAGRGVIYIHRKDDELHYFKGPANMQGLYI